ncbi:MAG: phosphoribosylanthranilate isomerase [Myxococcales bacterium]|nr:phosphoribosylanthranilate isomerase [Myxococcales bacterium]
MVAIKICGLTCVSDALQCVEAGADAIGLNFYPGSPRCIDVERAREIVEAVGDRTLTVGVFVDLEADAIEATKEATGLRCVQLHGHEPPELLERFLPHAYKAIRVRDASSLAEARRFGGQHILLDAYVAGQAGGTGQVFNWELAREFARERKVTLAGGLTPGNVAEAVAQVQPFCVDVASGVEWSPGRKDRALVEAFVRAVREAVGPEVRSQS